MKEVYKELLKDRPFLTSKSYSTFIKVCFDKDQYRTAGYQFGFVLHSYKDLIHLHKEAVERVDRLMREYNIPVQLLVHITFEFIPVKASLLSDFSLKPSNEDGYTLNSEKVDSPVIEFDNQLTNLDRIPVTTKLDNVIPSIQTEVKDGLVTNIPVEVKGEVINLLDKIMEQNHFLLLKKTGNNNVIHNFDDKWKFSLIEGIKYTNVLATRFDDESTVTKIRYSLNGLVISRVVDKLLPDNSVVRYYKNYQLNIRDKVTTIVKYVVNLIPIKRKNSGITNFVESDKIGSLDFEVIECNDGIYRVYCGGFMTKFEKQPVINYIDTQKFNGSNYELFYDVILNTVNSMLSNKYKGIKFYCHNLGGYDVIFLIGVLLRHNENNPDDTYKIDYVFRDKKIIKITISKKVLKQNQKLIICDSYAILASSQRNLCKSFEVSCLKVDFPYKFLHQDNLNYIGNTPDIMFFENISLDDYANIVKDNWNFKNESLDYLANDIKGLYQILRKANKSFFIKYDLDITSGLTISSLAMNLFHSKYYQNNIPLITNANMFNDLKKAYYGGITEVYKPYGENLYYYDVNSLYPFVAYNPMPGISCLKEYYYSDVNLNDLFGFYYCEVSSNDLYLGNINNRIYLREIVYLCYF